jgi:hypothetical protein
LQIFKATMNPDGAPLSIQKEWWKLRENSKKISEPVNMRS